MKIRVIESLTLAKPGEPWVPQVHMPKGEHEATRFPDWAIQRMIALKRAKAVKSRARRAAADQNGGLGDDPETAAALAKAKEEQEAMDEDKAKCE